MIAALAYSHHASLTRPMEHLTHIPLMRVAIPNEYLESDTSFSEKFAVISVNFPEMTPAPTTSRAPKGNRLRITIQLISNPPPDTSGTTIDPGEWSANKHIKIMKQPNLLIEVQFSKSLTAEPKEIADKALELVSKFQ